MTPIEYRDKELLHQIRLNRYNNGEVQKLLKLLDDACKEIKFELKKTNGISTKKRYNEIIQELNSISKVLKDNVSGNLDNTDLIEAEISHQREILGKLGFTDLALPSASQLLTAIKFSPYANSITYGAFLDGIQSGFYDTWDVALRTGYITGEPTAKIIKRVMGSVGSGANLTQIGTIKRLQQSIERNTRTYLSEMANVARERVYKKNEDLIDGYKWLATLDRSTCLVCGRLDNQIFLKLEDIPQHPPLHYNCRCVVLPIFNGFEDFDAEDTRASMNGPVPESLDYEDWLYSQPDKVKLEILGATRYKMYKDGDLDSIGSFVADNRILTIKELKEME